MTEPAVTRPRRPRAELAQLAQQLRQEGRTNRQIAEALGVSRSYAQALAGGDPLGERALERKRGYAGVCGRCGGPTNGSNGPAAAPSLCSTCAAIVQHEERYWTAERIVATFQKFARRHGRAPSVVDIPAYAHSPSVASGLSPARIEETDRVAAAGPRLPHPYVVSRELGSWADAVKAAGLQPVSAGAPSHRQKAKPPTRTRASRAPRAAANGRPVTERDARRAEVIRGEAVCPNCGDFVVVLVAQTGWCRPCTRAEAAA